MAKFIDSPIGSYWQSSIVEGINFCSLATQRFGKLKATKFDNSVLPDWMQSIEAFFDTLPLAITWNDLAQFFYAEEQPERIALGQLTKGELELTLAQLEAFPQIYFEDQSPQPEPEPDPTLSICEKLVSALQKIETISAAEIRMIIKEELTPLFDSVLQQGHSTRVELGEARRETELITNAVMFNSDRNNPVYITDKIYEKLSEENVEGQLIQQVWDSLHTKDSTSENPVPLFGGDAFPLSLPKSLITRFNNENLPLNPEIKLVKNWLELIEWLFLIFEELIGEFPSGIKIITEKKEVPTTDENGNPILDENGNPQTELETKSEVIQFPNIAEFLSEMFPLIYQNYLNSEKNQELITKALIEAGSAKKIAIQNAYCLEAIEDYLGADFTMETVEVPFSYTVGGTNILGISKPRKTKIEVKKYTQKRNFQDSLQQLLHSAGIIKTLFWRSMPKDAQGAASRFKELVNQQKSTADQLDQADQEELDTTFEEIENGFINKAGISDGLNPYGLTPENRPRIRQIGITAEDDQ